MKHHDTPTKGQKMTLADATKTIITTRCPGTFSLYGGYGMQNGEYVYFPLGVQEMEKRNKRGRVVKARYRYADGSELTYIYSTAHECYTLNTCNPLSFE